MSTRPSARAGRRLSKIAHVIPGEGWLESPPCASTGSEIDECVTSRLHNEPDFSDLLVQVYFDHVSNFEQIVVSLNDNPAWRVDGCPAMDWIPPSALGHQSILENAVLMAPAGVLFPDAAVGRGAHVGINTCRICTGRKSRLRVACPACRGVMTFVQVEPHPNGSGCELHTVKCQACGPTKSWTIDPRVFA